MITEYVHVFPSGASMVIVGFTTADNGITVTNMRFDPAPHLEVELMFTQSAVYIHIEPPLVA